MTLKEIALSVGTSVSTVSRVLNQSNYHCRDKELEGKIWKMASELSYTPSVTAQNLRKGTEPKDAVYVVDVFLARFQSMEQDGFFEELYHCLKEELMLQHCALGELLTGVDMITLGYEPSSHVHIPYKTSKRIKNEQNKNGLPFVTQKDNTGLIILGKCPSNLIPILKKRYSCIAGIDRNPTDYEYDEVVCDGAVAAQKAVEYLISLGHTNIAYIGDCTYESRYIGYYQTLLKYRISINHENIHPTDQTREAGFCTMNKIIDSSNPPTAIFCANDTTALGVLQALKKKTNKYYSPSVISIDNILASETTTPMLTTIDIPKKEMAHLALSLLVDRNKKRHQEIVRIELPCRLIQRESCE